MMEVASHVSHSSLMSSDRMKPGSGDCARPPFSFANHANSACPMQGVMQPKSNTLLLLYPQPSTVIVEHAVVCSSTLGEIGLKPKMPFFCLREQLFEQQYISMCGINKFCLYFPSHHSTQASQHILHFFCSIGPESGPQTFCCGPRKKGKKVKGKTVPLQEFIGDSPGVVPVRKYNWSDEVDNEDDGADSTNQLEG
uniref:(California timema) hypothetical protein n=1 Tax=Timema californicum TaxID=61474 RepID=A0A7R9P4K5_TIMCA|nr:unnamed protein product [Timema californicum]